MKLELEMKWAVSLICLVIENDEFLDIFVKTKEAFAEALSRILINFGKKAWIIKKKYLKIMWSDF